MKVYAVSDLHGMYDLYKQIKEFIQSDDVVYCLGDCGDRGPHSWETIVAIYNDPQFIYMKGNHEDMLMKAIDEWLPYHQHLSEYALLYQNGGERTFQGWKNGPERNNWRNRLSKLPTEEIYTNKDGKNIIMTHSGYTPLNLVKDTIWNRNHIYDTWPEEEEYKDAIILHGHTPFHYLANAYNVESPQTKRMIHEGENVHAVWYCEHHKCCIDAGAVFLGQTILLNLDTFEEQYFYIPKRK